MTSVADVLAFCIVAVIVEPVSADLTSLHMSRLSTSPKLETSGLRRLAAKHLEPERLVFPFQMLGDVGWWWWSSNPGVRLKGHIALQNQMYDSTSRPVIDDAQTVVVAVDLDLQKIEQVNEKLQLVTFQFTLNLYWIDAYLFWNVFYFDNITSIFLPVNSLWKPDIGVANSIDHTDAPGRCGGNVLLSHTGYVTWSSPHIAMTICFMDMYLFPYDSQQCNIEVRSWAYSVKEVNLTLLNENLITRHLDSSPEWTVVKVEHRREVRNSSSQPSYALITFFVTMKRNAIHHTFTLILPGIVIYGTTMLGFWAPLESCEKIDLEVTAFVAEIVFLRVIGDITPAKSSLPLIGWYYVITLILMTLQLFFGVMVTNAYYKSHKVSDILPAWLCKLLFSYESMRAQKKLKMEYPNQKSVNQKKRSAASAKRNNCNSHIYSHIHREQRDHYQSHVQIKGHKNVRFESVIRRADKRSKKIPSGWIIRTRHGHVHHLRTWKEFADKLNKLFMSLFISFNGIVALIMVLIIVRQD